MAYNKFLLPSEYMEEVEKLLSDWDTSSKSMMELILQRKTIALDLEYADLSEDWIYFFKVSLANAYFKKLGFRKLGGIGVFVDNVPDGFVRLHEKVKKEIKVDEERTIHYILRSALYWIHTCEDRKTYRKYLKALEKWYKVPGVRYRSWLRSKE